MSETKQRFSSFFYVASKLSFKSPRPQDTKEVSELQTREVGQIKKMIETQLETEQLRTSCCFLPKGAFS